MRKFFGLSPFVGEKILLAGLCAVMLCWSGCKKKKTDPDSTPGPTGPGPADTTMVFVNAADANIVYSGRIDFSNPLAPAFSFPGVSVKAKFQGSAIDVVIKDYSTGTAITTNYFTVVIDGNVHKIVRVNSTDTLYTAARGLSNTEHTIELFKRTEAVVGRSSFKGFRILENTSLLSVSAATRKVEFIGDSFTCGYGNDTSYATGTNSGFHSVYENNYTAWGAIVARELGAQYHCTAYSGRGMYRNSTGSTSGTVPLFYNRIHPDNPAPLWDASRYVPDLIVIHLGTNDFAQEQLGVPNMLDSAQFVNAYINFVNTLRGHYASASVICTVPNSMTDSYPAGLKSYTRIKNYHQAVVDHFITGGDTKVKYFELTPQTAPYGEDWHPSNATHASMAAQIKPFIKTLMSW